MQRKELVACFPKDAGLDEACFKISYDILIVGVSRRSEQRVVPAASGPCCSRVCTCVSPCALQRFPAACWLAVAVQVGSVNNTFGIKGVKEHCMFFKSIEDASALRRRISECFERAALPYVRQDACCEQRWQLCAGCRSRRGRDVYPATACRQPSIVVRNMDSGARLLALRHLLGTRVCLTPLTCALSVCCCRPPRRSASACCPSWCAAAAPPVWRWQQRCTT